MQTLELTAEEIEVLREILQHEFTQLEIEIFRTDTPDFKQKLKHRRDLLEHVLTKLFQAPVSA